MKEIELRRVVFDALAEASPDVNVHELMDTQRLNEDPLALDSLGAIQLWTRISERIGILIDDDEDLERLTTIGGLIARVEELALSRPPRSGSDG